MLPIKLAFLAIARSTDGSYTAYYRTGAGSWLSAVECSSLSRNPGSDYGAPIVDLRLDLHCASDFKGVFLDASKYPFAGSGKGITPIVKRDNQRRDMVHPHLLRSFLAVVDHASFTDGARRLGIAQSTISQHVARLVSVLGRSLVGRDTHHVALTPDGDALVSFARRIVDANVRLERFVSGSELRGKIRLGAGEDFTSSLLPRVLANFTARHSLVDLQLTVGLSVSLYQTYDAGGLDVIIVKRRHDDDRGHVAWTEQLAWIGRPGFVVDPTLPVPLILYPAPSITRVLAIEALETIGRSWRVACTTGSLTGLRAAAEAGLGIAPHSARLLPQGLTALQAETLPPLSAIEYIVLGPGAQHEVASALIELILDSVGPTKF